MCGPHDFAGTMISTDIERGTAMLDNKIWPRV